MRYFRNIVDAKSWEEFCRDTQSAAVWGFSEEHRAKARTEVGKHDRFVCMLGNSAWCGVLEITGDLLSPDDHVVRADRTFPTWGGFHVRFPVKARVALPTGRALSISHKAIWPNLQLTKDRTYGDRGWNGPLRRDLTKLDARDGSLLERCLLAAASGAPLPFEGADAPDERDEALSSTERTVREILGRRGQAAFRDALLRAYEEKCCISGCEIVELLEAAHIVPHSEGGSTHVTNGLLLRADLHTLFDLRLLHIEPENHTVLLSEHLHSSEYEAFHNRRLRAPATASDAPSTSALRKRASNRHGAANV